MLQMQDQNKSHIWDLSMERSLPIDLVIPEIKEALETERRVIIKAPPGAGKTTRIPLALLDEPWLENNKILLLEPRRLAARAAAGHMARLLNEPLGRTVGYHISMDRVVSPMTRIEVITEGILTRRIQNDPGLAGTGLVIFDEFHERNLNSDLGLALCLDAMDVLCENLKVVVMSATFDTVPLCELMDCARAIESPGKIFSVDTRYLESSSLLKRKESLEKSTARMVMKSLARDSGDILVFLPGAGEIGRTATILNNSELPQGVSVLPLYGNLTQKEQDRAISPSIAGSRKIVLATSIAETSITIEGVHVVVDSGLVRESRFSPKTGMSTLETLTASKTSVDQRRGRAGRTGPGICYRLWSTQSHRDLRKEIRPEIFNTDLAGLALELALWGVRDPKELKWLDLPPEPAMDQARRLLMRLDALDSMGRITAHGKKLAALGVHPRLGHMLIKGKSMGIGSLACLVAALIQEPDFIVTRNGSTISLPNGNIPGDADLRWRVELLCSPGQKPHGTTVKQGTMVRIKKIAQKLRKQLAVKEVPVDLAKVGISMALVYPERIAMNRNTKDGRFILASGQGAFLPKTDALAWEEMIVAAHLDGKNANAKIFMAASFSLQDLEQTFGQDIKVVDEVFWDRSSGNIVAVRKKCYMNLVLSTIPLENPNRELVLSAMVQGIREQGIGILAWTPALRRFQARAVFLHQTLYQGLSNFLEDESFPDLSDQALENSLEQWLVPFIGTISSMSRIKKMDLKQSLFSLLTFNQKQLLESHAPSHIMVPSGSRIALDYGAGEGRIFDSPILKVRIQEMFSCMATPTVARGKVPVTIHFLSPAQRPVQVTRDLESFWNNTYTQIKKDLKGRYPKHFWPDDPSTAPATKRVKPA